MFVEKLRRGYIVFVVYNKISGIVELVLFGGNGLCDRRVRKGIWR